MEKSHDEGGYALVQKVEKPIEADCGPTVGVKSKTCIATSSEKQDGYITGIAGALA
jgi:hypothetical protein